MDVIIELPSSPLVGGSEYDLALGPLLLRSAPEGWIEAVRIWVPNPTAAFSRRDSTRPGFATAVAAVRAHGFAAVVRPQGGRLAAFHEGSVVVDHVVREVDAAAGLTGRFQHFASFHAEVLRGLGLDARVGELPGEYCPGEYSVNAAGRHKIAGSAQRVTKSGWLFSTVIQVAGGDRLRSAIAPAYAALDYPLNPGTIGAMVDHLPGTDVMDVVAAMRAAYTATRTARRAEVPDEVLGLLDASATLHRVL